MSDKISVMVMGGHTKGFHEFGKMAPIYKEFLEKAGFQVKLTEDRDDFLKEQDLPIGVVHGGVQADQLEAALEKRKSSAATRACAPAWCHKKANRFRSSRPHTP